MSLVILRRLLTVYILIGTIVTVTTCSSGNQHISITGTLRNADGSPFSKQEIHCIEAEVGSIQEPSRRDALMMFPCTELLDSTFTGDDGKFEIKLLRKFISDDKEYILGIRSVYSSTLQVLCQGNGMLKFKIERKSKRVDLGNIDGGAKCPQLICKYK